MDLQKRLEKFLRNRTNLVFVLVLLFALGIRIYYFTQTFDQPLWWDEADYVSMSKSLVGGANYPFTIQRPPLFPVLGALFYFIGGGNETFVRFFLVLLPSLGVVIMTYVLGRSLYNRKVGLVASFIMSVFWVLLFNTFRLHTDALALLFIMLSMYFLWQYYIKFKDTNKLWLVGLFLSLAFMTRIVYGLFIPLFAIFILSVKGTTVFKEKWLYVTGAVSFLAILPYLIWSKLHFDKFLAFSQGYTSYGSKAEALPFAWGLFDYFKLYTGDVLFILFLLGLGLALMELVLGFDLIRKRRRIKAHFLLLLTIIIPTVYFAFIERSAGEPRWLIMVAPAMFYFIGLILIKGYVMIRKYQKYVGLSVVLILLYFGASHELKTADEIIDARKDSYLPVKLSGLWIKENSQEGDTVLSHSVPQTAYYSERETRGVPGNAENLKIAIEEIQPRYLIISVFEPHSEESLQYPQTYINSLVPVQGYFADDAQTQPILVIYEFVNYDFLEVSSNV